MAEDKLQVFRQTLGKKVSNKTAPLTAKDTMERFWKEFAFELEGNHRSEATITTYRKHFHKMCEFIGYTVLSAQDENVDYEETREEAREIGLTYPIEVLETPQIGAHYHEYLEKVCRISDQSVMSGMRHFRRFVYYAVEKGLIIPQKVKVPNIEAPIKEVFTKEEIYRLTSKKPNIEDFVEYRCYTMIIYLLATGNRIGSILALNVGDVDFLDNSIRVNFTKTRQPQRMSIQDKLKNILAEYVRAWREAEDGTPLFDEPLFPNNYGGRMSYEGVSHSMSEYFARHGVEWRGFHKFRHSYAAEWIRSGGDSLTLKTQLGHKSLTMTSRYANLYGMAVAKDAKEHSLVNKVDIKSGRKAIKINKQSKK